MYAALVTIRKSNRLVSFRVRAGSVTFVTKMTISDRQATYLGRKAHGKTGHRYNFGANPCVCFSGAERVWGEKSYIPTEKIQ